MRKINKKAFGEYIKAKRIERGYTQNDLADKLGTTVFTISRWENGKCYPDLEMLDDLAMALDTTSEDILENSRTEVFSGISISAGMIVVVAMVVGAIVFGVFKQHKKDEDISMTEENEQEYSLNYGVYNMVTDESENLIVPYIGIYEDHIMAGCSMFASYAQFYDYERKGNTLYLKDFEKNGSMSVLGNNIHGDDTITIEDGYITYGGIRFEICIGAIEDTDDNVNDNEGTSLNGVFIRTKDVVMVYIDAYGPVILEDTNLDLYKTGDYVNILSGDDLIIEETYPARISAQGYYLEKINNIDIDIDSYNQTLENLKNMGYEIIE